MPAFEIIVNNTGGGALLPKSVECVSCRASARVKGNANVCYSSPVEHSIQTAKCAKCGVFHMVFNVLRREDMEWVRLQAELICERLDYEPVVWVRDGFVSP